MTKQAKILDATKQTTWEVDVRNIKPLERAGGNLREDYGDLDELAASIEEHGIKNPIQAYRDKDNDGEWFAIDGHRRLAASMKLVKEKGLAIRAKVIVVDYRTLNDEQITVDMFTTNDGKRLNFLEMAEGVRRLSAYGNTPNEIAKKISKPAPFVKNLLLLSSATRSVKEMIKSNLVSTTLVLKIFKSTESWDETVLQLEKAFAVAKQSKAVKKGVSVEELEGNGADPVKITKRSVDKSVNRLDSAKELIRALDDVEASAVKHINFHNFLCNLSENKLTKKEIIEFLTQ